ncbi:unnamed protein product [Nezara viridula]|uniref:Uncharacterized protein n=1 Tax=Nezara viridula TaxID=85310 RepID=A0A9P0MR02_NEZVI|nr:unnamed protein product [Nezara viridula]
MRIKDEIMEKIRNHHASKDIDIDRVLNSKSNPRYRKICSFNVNRPEDSLQFRALNLNKLRAVSRLRVASKDFMKIYLKDAILTIKSSEVCGACNCLVTDPVTHFLIQCIKFNEPKNKYLKAFITEPEKMLVWRRY